MENRFESERIAAIGRDLVANDPALAQLRASSARIGYLESDAERRRGGKAVLGECEKVPSKYRWAVPYDFTVTVFTENAWGFTDEQLRILVLHELLHVGIERDGNDERLYVRPHDFEDFDVIAERHGIEWSRR